MVKMKLALFVAVLFLASAAQADVAAQMGGQSVSLFDRSSLFRPNPTGAPGRFLSFGEPIALGDEDVVLFNLQPNASFAWNPATTEHTGILTGLAIGGVIDAETWAAPTAATTKVDIFFVPSGRYTGAHAAGWAQVFQESPTPTSKLLWTDLSNGTKGRSPADVNGSYPGTFPIVMNSGATPSTAGPFTDGTLFLDGSPVQVPGALSMFVADHEAGPAGTHPFIGLGWMEMKDFQLPTPVNQSFVGSGQMFFDVLGGSFAPLIGENTFFSGADVRLEFRVDTIRREGFNLGSEDPMSFNVIPEPMSLLLIGGAMAGLGIIRRKRAA